MNAQIAYFLAGMTRLIVLFTFSTIRLQFGVISGFLGWVTEGTWKAGSFWLQSGQVDRAFAYFQASVRWRGAAGRGAGGADQIFPGSGEIFHLTLV